MQRFRTPVVDAPVAAIGSSSVLPVDSDGLPRDPVDRRIEQAVRRAFDAAAGSLRASVAGSMFSRAVFLWIRELLADFDVPAEVRKDLKKIEAASAFAADATADAVQLSARSMAASVTVRRNTWLRHWDVDAASQSRVIGLPFKGGKLFVKNKTKQWYVFNSAVSIDKFSAGFFKGLLKNETIPEVGEDAAASVNVTEALSEEEQDELRQELAKVEEEIQTLSQVLAAKEKHLAEIKRKLGINSLQELKQNLSKGWQDVTSTNAYKKTSETLSHAGQKASAAFSSVGTAITKKLEDVKNSPTFKSFEEKVENLKYKVGGTKPAGSDFGEVLNSTANAGATETTTKQTEEETQ
ncbi:hypothetical protein lerEdw1_008921 [Lerista edwardsae]|nr:hypothetical protein lerEdw1_008921 [Lerista edwardsae]